MSVNPIDDNLRNLKGLVQRLIVKNGVLAVGPSQEQPPINATIKRCSPDLTVKEAGDELARLHKLLFR